MDRLRLRLAGRLMGLSLRVMPRGRMKDLMCDFVDEWFREMWVEMGRSSGEVADYSVTKRYR